MTWAEHFVMEVHEGEGCVVGLGVQRSRQHIQLREEEVGELQTVGEEQAL